jgi:hypothetical protein
MGFDSIDLIIGDDRRSVESSRQREQTRSAVPRAPKGTQPALPHRVRIEPLILPPKEKFPTARQSNSPSYEQWVQGSPQQQQEIIRTTTIIIIVTTTLFGLLLSNTDKKPPFPAEKRGPALFLTALANLSSFSSHSLRLTFIIYLRFFDVYEEYYGVGQVITTIITIIVRPLGPVRRTATCDHQPYDLRVLVIAKSRFPSRALSHSPINPKQTSPINTFNTTLTTTTFSSPLSSSQ